MFRKGGPPRENGSTVPLDAPHSIARRLRTDRAQTGALVLAPFVVLAGSYAAVIATDNFREVVPHRVYRSGQPSPEELRDWISRYGLKTIVNLRGPTAPLAAEEEAAAASMGVDFHYLELSAHRLMSRSKLLRLIELLRTARQPILLHCYHGVDRAGTASALAAWLVGRQPYARAKWQAYVPPGPWKYRNGSHHISDVLALYEDYCRRHGVSPDDLALFEHWAAHVYRPPSSDEEHAPGADEDAGSSCGPYVAR